MAIPHIQDSIKKVTKYFTENPDKALLVPYVQGREEIFLKTIIPSRKATNKYVRTKK